MISPDEQRLVYAAGFTGNSYAELYSVPLSGGPAVQLNAGLSDVAYPAYRPFDASGNAVIFGSHSGLFRSNLTGGTPTLLSQPFQVLDYVVSTDGTRVGYRFGADLFGVATTGGPLVQYTNDGAGGHFYSEHFFTSDTSRFIYEDEGGSRQRVLSVPTAGGTPTDLTSGFTNGTSVQFVSLATPAGNDRIVFQTYPSIGINRPMEIYSVRPDGTDRVRLNMPLGPTNSVETDTFFLTPDGNFVVFGIVEQARHNFLEAAWYVTPAEGGPIVRLTPELPALAVITEFQMTQDGKRFFYTADDRTHGVNELYQVGTPMARVTAGAGIAADVNGGPAIAGGASAVFGNVTTPGVLVAETSLIDSASITPGSSSSFGELADAASGQALVWNLSFTGQFSGGLDLTLQFANPYAATDGTSHVSLFQQSQSGSWLPFNNFELLSSGALRLHVDSLTRLAVLQISDVPEPATLMSLLLLAASCINWRPVTRRSPR